MPEKKKRKKKESAFLSNTLQLPKKYCCLKGSPASPFVIKKRHAHEDGAFLERN
jgi:hypothetical protein